MISRLNNSHGMVIKGDEWKYMGNWNTHMMREISRRIFGYIGQKIFQASLECWEQCFKRAINSVDEELQAGVQYLGAMLPSILKIFSKRAPNVLSSIESKAGMQQRRLDGSRDIIFQARSRTGQANFPRKPILFLAHVLRAHYIYCAILAPTRTIVS